MLGTVTDILAVVVAEVAEDRPREVAGLRTLVAVDRDSLVVAGPGSPVVADPDSLVE